MPFEIFTVDAFADQPFSGNPAAVCLPDASVSADWMQAVAAEMNLSETAFLQPLDDACWHLRWFTPTVEVALCGHATLAAAHVLWRECRVAADVLLFDTCSGRLTARREGERIALDFPLIGSEAAEISEDLHAALGVAPTEVKRAGEDLLVCLASAQEVRALNPDLRVLSRIAVRGVIVTAPADDDVHDFVSRFFAPRVGVDEDPVTGSAHCALAPYWQARFGRARLRGYQASSRGGTVEVEVSGERVGLRGQAITTLRGQLDV